MMIQLNIINILLNKLLSKYKLKTINHKNINIYTKYYDEIKAFNY